MYKNIIVAAGVPSSSLGLIEIIKVAVVDVNQFKLVIL